MELLPEGELRVYGGGNGKTKEARKLAARNVSFSSVLLILQQQHRIPQIVLVGFDVVLKLWTISSKKEGVSALLKK